MELKEIKRLRRSENGVETWEEIDTNRRHELKKRE